MTPPRDWEQSTTLVCSPKASDVETKHSIGKSENDAGNDRIQKKNEEKRLPDLFVSTDFGQFYPSQHPTRSLSSVCCGLESRQGKAAKSVLIYSQQKFPFQGIQNLCEGVKTRRVYVDHHLAGIPVFSPSTHLAKQNNIRSLAHGFPFPDVWLRYDDGTPRCDVCRPTPRVVEPTPSYASRRLAISAK